METVYDKAHRAMAWVKSHLDDDAEAFRALGPGSGAALERLWNLDPLGAAMVEREEKADRELATWLLSLVIVVAEDASSMGREWLAEYLARRLSELPPPE